MAGCLWKPSLVTWLESQLLSHCSQKPLLLLQHCFILSWWWHLALRYAGFNETDKGTGTDLCSLGPQGLAVPEVMVSSVYKGGGRQEAPQSPSFWSVSCASSSKRSCLGKYQVSSS